MRRGDGLTEVDLVETPHDDAPADHGDGDDGGVAPAPSSARWRRWWFVPVALLAAVVVAWSVQAVLDGRAGAVDARIAALPGAVPDIGTTLEPVWSMRPDAHTTIVAADDGMLVFVEVADGAYRLVGIAPGEGGERWSVPLGDAPAAVVDGADTQGRVVCDGPGQTLLSSITLRGTVVCLVTDGYETFGDGTSESTAPTRSRVVVVDLSDGAVRSERDVPPSWSGAVLASGDVALALVDDAPGPTIVAVDPRTGDERWRFHDDRTPERGAASSEVSVSAAGGGVIVLGPAATPFLLTGDGERSEELDAGFSSSTGGLVTLGSGNDEHSLVPRPGAPDLDVTGRALVPLLDDGSGHDLVVSSSRDTVWGWDRATGHRRWSADVALAGDADGGGRAVVTDGRVLATTDKGAVALDASTGRVVWRHDLPAPGSSAVLGVDGPHLLLLSADEDGSRQKVVVLDRRSGELVREVTVPVEFSWVVGVGGLLLGFQDNELAVLR